MKTPHKHADLIKAWADGAEIEIKTEDGRWAASSPSWQSFLEYRIKPEPKPDLVRYVEITPAGWNYISGIKNTGANLILIFDGETGKLKAAKVIA